MELHTLPWDGAGPNAASVTTARLRSADLLVSPGPLLIAHRGSSSQAPENTRPSFESALAAGVDMVELDYRHSADGIPIVIHDETLDRTTDAPSRWGYSGIGVAERSAAELAELDVGAWFGATYAGTRLSTLAQALDIIDPGAMTLIERKAGDPQTLIDLLRSKGLLERVIVQAFDWDFLSQCQRLAPELILGALGREELTESLLDEARSRGFPMIGWKEAFLTAENIAAARQRQLTVSAWTVDDPDRAAQLISFGVHAITSNVPGIVLAHRSRAA